MVGDCDINDDGNDGDDDDQVGKVAALAFLLNGSETELFLCEEAAVKITLARFDVTTYIVIVIVIDFHHQPSYMFICDHQSHG